MTHRMYTQPVVLFAGLASLSRKTTATYSDCVMRGGGLCPRGVAFNGHVATILQRHVGDFVGNHVLSVVVPPTRVDVPH